MSSDERQPALLARPVTRIGGTLDVPGDKSISHRAVLLGAVADGTTTVRGFLRGEEFPRQLNAIDIGLVPDPLNPYNDRSTMIKVMEYMAMEKPMVAFDLTEHRVTAGEAALYADCNSEYDFAKKLSLLMDEPELRRKMGRLGRERVEKELAWQHQARRLVAVYRKLDIANREAR